MLKTYFFFVSAIFIFFLCSCKKDEVVDSTDCTGPYDTLITDYNFNYDESSPYLAAYDGSWWALSNDDSLFCDLSSTSLLEFVSYNHEECKVNYNNTIWTGVRINGPEYNGFALGFVDGDFLIGPGGSGETINKKIMNTPYLNDLNETVWEVFSENWEEVGVEIGITVEKKLLEMHETYTLPNGDEYNDVAEIEVLNLTSYGTDGYLYYEYMYYAKDVGLIRYHKPESETTGPEMDNYVVNYFIAPH